MFVVVIIVIVVVVIVIIIIIIIIIIYFDNVHFFHTKLGLFRCLLPIKSLQTHPINAADQAIPCHHSHIFLKSSCLCAPTFHPHHNQFSAGQHSTIITLMLMMPKPAKETSGIFRDLLSHDPLFGQKIWIWP